MLYVAFQGSINDVEIILGLEDRLETIVVTGLRYLLLTRLLRYFFVSASLLLLLLYNSSHVMAQTMVLPGKFDVSSEGAASFSIPVSVPPGSGGMVPSLSIDYTSGGGNGLLGVGWGLDGLAAITRCPRTIAEDGYHGAITYDVGITDGQPDNDRFCLNGQRLIAVSGNYGADRTQYRTELETFSEIISHGYTGNSPSWFEVHTKSGQVLQLGNTTDSRVMLSGISSARSWLENQVSDTVGNYMSIKYSVNPSNTTDDSNVVPNEIDYTGNGYANVLPYNKVTFVYATRPDLYPLYTGGALSESTVRLTDIKTWAASTEVNDYEFGYQTSGSSGRSLLSSVTICDGADKTCLPARTFAYSAGGSNGVFSEVNHSLGSGISYGTPPTTDWTAIQGDFNGDGKTDFAFISGTVLHTYLTQSDGTFSVNTQTFSINFGTPPSSPNVFGNGTGSPPTSAFSLVQGDLNGDGKSDFALASPGSVTFYKPEPQPGGGIYTPPPTYNPGTVYSFLSQGNGQFTVDTASIPYFASSPANLAFFEGDFNGDGRTDFAYVTNNQISTYLSNVDGTFKNVVSTISQNFGAPPAASWAPISGDFNGDGESDFGFISGSTSWVYLSNGDGTFNAVGHSVSGSLGAPPNANFTEVEGDFNGDGLTDVAFLANTYLFTLLSKGDGTFIPTTQQLGGLNYGTPPSANWNAITGDFNGDGLSDFAMIQANVLWTFTSNGNGNFTPISQTLTSSFGAPPNGWTQVGGDFNGDGRSDFGFIINNTLVSELSSGAMPDLLVSISNGLASSNDANGATTTVSYGTPPQGWGAYYQGWNTPICTAQAPTYPNESITPTIPVVTSTSSSNGIGSTDSSGFTYSCAQVNVAGRGYLGFAQQMDTDDQTGIVQATDFEQGFPYIGLVTSESKTYGSVTLNLTTNTYNVLNGTSSPALPWPGTSFPYISKSIVSSNDLDGAVLPTATTTTTYDSYGNALTVKTSKALGSTQGSTQTTTNAYASPNTTLWILGRLTQSQVLSTSP